MSTPEVLALILGALVCAWFAGYIHGVSVGRRLEAALLEARAEWLARLLDRRSQ